MTNPKPLRGLAALKLSNPKRFAEIVSKGGKASSGNFKNLTPKQRQEFGRKGGKVSRGPKE